MANATTPVQTKPEGAVQSPQFDPTLCPSWCDGAHLRTQPEDTWFHDGSPSSMEVRRDHGSTLSSGRVHLFVSPSQIVSGDTHGPSVVEVQDDGGTLALLTAREARELGRRLLLSADLAEPPSNDQILEDLRLTRDRFRRLEEKVTARIEAGT